MIYNYKCSTDAWGEFMKVMLSGERFEIDEKMFYYWLEVIPPVFMNREINYLPDNEGPQQRVDFGFAEGAEAITVFWRDLEKRRFYGQRTNEINRSI